MAMAWTSKSYTFIGIGVIGIGSEIAAKRAACVVDLCAGREALPWIGGDERIRQGFVTRSGEIIIIHTSRMLQLNIGFVIVPEKGLKLDPERGG